MARRLEVVRKNDWEHAVIKEQCRYESTSEGCRKADNCPFLHTGGGDRAICTHFARGRCDRGNDCKFIHPVQDTRKDDRKDDRARVDIFDDRPQRDFSYDGSNYLITTNRDNKSAERENTGRKLEVGMFPGRVEISRGTTEASDHPKDHHSRDRERTKEHSREHDRQHSREHSREHKDRDPHKDDPRARTSREDPHREQDRREIHRDHTDHRDHRDHRDHKDGDHRHDHRYDQPSDHHRDYYRDQREHREHKAHEPARSESNKHEISRSETRERTDPSPSRKAHDRRVEPKKSSIHKETSRTDTSSSRPSTKSKEKSDRQRKPEEKETKKQIDKVEKVSMTVKITLMENGIADTRRLQLDCSDWVEAFREMDTFATQQSTYGNRLEKYPPGTGFIFQYMDDENDLVGMTSAIELQEAANVMLRQNQKILKVQVSIMEGLRATVLPILPPPVPPALSLPAPPSLPAPLALPHTFTPPPPTNVSQAVTVMIYWGRGASSKSTIKVQGCLKGLKDSLRIHENSRCVLNGCLFLVDDEKKFKDHALEDGDTLSFWTASGYEISPTVRPRVERLTDHDVPSVVLCAVRYYLIPKICMSEVLGRVFQRFKPKEWLTEYFGDDRKITGPMDGFEQPIESYYERVLHSVETMSFLKWTYYNVLLKRYEATDGKEIPPPFTHGKDITVEHLTRWFGSMANSRVPWRLDHEREGERNAERGGYEAESKLERRAPFPDDRPWGDHPTDPRAGPHNPVPHNPRAVLSHDDSHLRHKRLVEDPTNPDHDGIGKRVRSNGHDQHQQRQPERQPDPYISYITHEVPHPIPAQHHHPDRGLPLPSHHPHSRGDSRGPRW